MQQPQSIPFLQPMTTKAEYKANTMEKVKSFIEMEPEELELCINTYYGEKEKIKRELRKQGHFQGKRLNKKQVFEILGSNETQTRLAAKYDTSVSSIGFIKRGMSYKEFFREWEGQGMPEPAA